MSGSYKSNLLSICDKYIRVCHANQTSFTLDNILEDYIVSWGVASCPSRMQASAVLRSTARNLGMQINKNQKAGYDEAYLLRSHDEDPDKIMFKVPTNVLTVSRKVIS